MSFLSFGSKPWNTELRGRQWHSAKAVARAEPFSTTPGPVQARANSEAAGRAGGPGPGRQRAQGGRPPAGVALPSPVLAVRGPRQRAAESGQEPSRLFIPLPCDRGSVPAPSHFFHFFQLKAQVSVLLGSPRKGYGIRVLLQGPFPWSCPRALRAPAAARCWWGTFNSSAPCSAGGGPSCLI